MVKEKDALRGRGRRLRLSGAWDCRMERPDSQKCLFQTFGGSSFVSPGREAEHENDFPKAIRKSALDETIKGGPKYLLLFMLADYSARDKGQSANVSSRSDLTPHGNPASSQRNPTSALSVTATRATGTKPQLRRAASSAQIHADIVI